jgi:phosphoribosyl 1,2-cyclic phosphate phosphodiesterase
MFGVFFVLRKRRKRMRVKIIGSGGCVSIPRPCCKCRVCKEAREMGFPYARTGASLFIEGENILIDTPEDINYALNNAEIENVQRVLYSHIDPDHTMGMRVFEQLRLDWLTYTQGIKCSDPIEVICLPNVLEDLRKQGTKYGSALNYYESMGLVTTKAEKNLKFKDMNIEIIPANKDENVSMFLISNGDKKLIYAPCDVKPFIENDKFMNADVLIIGDTIVGEVLKDNRILDIENRLREELFVMDEIIELKEKYNIKNVIITHLEEDWGKTFDDYKNLEKEYQDIFFAYDGMEVEL